MFIPMTMLIIQNLLGPRLQLSDINSNATLKLLSKSLKENHSFPNIPGIHSRNSTIENGNQKVNCAEGRRRSF